jgi:hypothetical protein
MMVGAMAGAMAGARERGLCTGRALGEEAVGPFLHGGPRDGAPLRHLAYRTMLLRHVPHHHGSAQKGQSGMLMDIHSAAFLGQTGGRFPVSQIQSE